ncbi:hypothetical protein [Neisseria gonorrhoeae]|uniref:hypothetical protein n=1 Tax=Neisseria gonorrhoeae TaxID=485 RepID=UPI000F500EE1|nr:hypothetical protein [Neisseria gonorrhoeae]ROU56530.1 hypothetical protein EGO78_12490 [Neisseria gonorrhoeae]
MQNLYGNFQAVVLEQVTENDFEQVMNKDGSEKQRDGKPVFQLTKDSRSKMLLKDGTGLYTSFKFLAFKPTFEAGNYSLKAQITPYIDSNFINYIILISEVLK